MNLLRRLPRFYFASVLIGVPSAKMASRSNTKQRKIAIVGSGVSGIGALYALRHSQHEVHMFEKDSRLGGHTNTMPWKHGHKTVPVDTGFIVTNDATYPNFLAFLRELNIDCVPTAMTFGVCRDYGAFEWSGTSLGSVFAQYQNAFSLRFWRMIFDIIRFNQFALDLLTEVDGTLENDNEQSVGDYLEQNGYSDAFRDDYLIPMTACVWSTGADKCTLEFPAVTLVRFLWNHHLMSTVARRPDWRTIMGGSKQYIDAVLRDFHPKEIHLSSGVKSVENTPEGRVAVMLENGKRDVFDDVILACHGDTARDIITSSATKKEMDIMSAFQTTENTVFMHSDLTVGSPNISCFLFYQEKSLTYWQLMPRRRIAWSAWNYLTLSGTEPTSTSAIESVSLTYNMNILQHIPTEEYGDILVTMNPPHVPSAEVTQAVLSYKHPIYNAAAVRSQSRLAEIQGTRGLWYAGAWTGYGFHEDGFKSGIDVGRKLGGQVPWKTVETQFIRGRVPVLTWKDNLVRIFILGFQFWIMAVDLISGWLHAVLGSKSKPKAF